MTPEEIFRLVAPAILAAIAARFAAGRRASANVGKEAAEIQLAAAFLNEVAQTQRATALDAAEIQRRTAVDVAAINERSASAVARINEESQRRIARENARRESRKEVIDPLLALVRREGELFWDALEALDERSLTDASDLLKQLDNVRARTRLTSVRAVASPAVEAAVATWYEARRRNLETLCALLEAAEHEELQSEILAARQVAVSEAAKSLGKAIKELLEAAEA